MILRNSQLRGLRRRSVPTWWRDAKLGIMVHWTPASVPAFAPTDVAIGDLLRSGRRDSLAHSPYAEWYENSLRFPGSPVARRHHEVKGTKMSIVSLNPGVGKDLGPSILWVPKNRSNGPGQGNAFS